MGVMHIVLLRMKPTVTPSVVSTLMAELANFQKTMPELVRRSTAGENFTNRNKGFTHAFVIELDDREGLEKYQVHQRHQEVRANLILPNIDELLAMDYDF